MLSTKGNHRVSSQTKLHFQPRLLISSTQAPGSVRCCCELPKAGDYREYIQSQSAVITNPNTLNPSKNSKRASMPTIKSYDVSMLWFVSLLIRGRIRSCTKEILSGMCKKWCQRSKVLRIFIHFYMNHQTRKGWAMLTLFAPFTAASKEFSKWTFGNRDKLSHESQRPATQK